MSNEPRLWWVIRGEQKFGPYTQSELAAMAAAGRIADSDLIGKEGEPGAVPATLIPGLLPTAAAKPQTPPPPPPGNSNPYRTPIAAVRDPDATEQVAFGTEPHTVEAGNGTVWFGDAWEIFKRSPLIWIVSLAIYGIFQLVMSVIPLLGGLAQSLLNGVFLAGFMAMAHRASSEGTVDINQLFEGFRQKTGPLIMLGLINLALLFVIFLVLGIGFFVVLGGGLLQAAANPEAFAQSMLSSGALISIFILVATLLIAVMLVAAANWFAPQLIFFSDMSPTDALTTSFRACLQNWLPFLVYSIVGLLLFVASLIPVGLGLLIFLPVSLITLYTSYRDIFGKPA
jgi:uncharacterized membrane protein